MRRFLSGIGVSCVSCLPTRGDGRRQCDKPKCLHEFTWRLAEDGWKDKRASAIFQGSLLETSPVMCHLPVPLWIPKRASLQGSMHAWICAWSVRLSVCPSVRPSVCLSVCPSVLPSGCLSVCIHACMYIHTYVCTYGFGLNGSMYKHARNMSQSLSSSPAPTET